MPHPMTSRERVLAAARHHVPDRIPRTIIFESAVIEKLHKHFGTRNLREITRDDFAGVGPRASRLQTDFSPYFRSSNVTWDEWGRGRIWDSEQHYAEYLYPLDRAESVDEILAYPWPDLLEPYRYQQLDAQVAGYKEQGLAVSAGLAETVFEIAWQLRSFDRLFEDIHQNEEKAAILLDQITDRRVAAARAFARAGVDILQLGDDVAMQERLMMSRKMWTKWFRPRLERVIRAAKEVKPDILIWYHSDGRIDDLVPDLIEAGVEILNPVQPECVDHHRVKASYGDRLAFSGGLGVQSVLPFGTPDEVREHVCQTIKTLGEGGGLIVGPSHVIERDTPIENIMAMLDAIDDFGRYE